MLRQITDKNIWLINGGILLVGLAYGIAISILAVFLKENDYHEHDIGNLAVWFALGIVALSLPMAHVINALSARVTLVLSILGYAVTVTLFPFAVGDFWLAAVDRFADGAFSVGIWVSCETIILSRAHDRHKAFVTSLYSIAIGIGYILGSVCARAIVLGVSMPAAFWTAGVISLATAAIVAWRLDPDVTSSAPPASEVANARSAASKGPGPVARGTGFSAIAWRIKTSLFATFAYGYFQASVVLFLPLYLIDNKSIAEDRTILLPGFFAIGMLAFTNIAGRLGDRHGHLVVMRVLAMLGTATVLAFVWLDRYAAMCAAVAVAGATLAAISPVSLALQGVITEPRNYHRSNAVYNACYAAGMLFGPPISGRIYSAAGGPAMLYHLAGLWAAFVAFTILFARDDPRAYKTRGTKLGAELGG